MLTEALMCARHVPGACGDRKAKGTDAAVIEVFIWWKHSYPFQDADHGLACWDAGVLGDLSHCQLGGKPEGQCVCSHEAMTWGHLF